MILIKNRVRTIPFDTKKCTRDIQILLRALKYDDYDITILLTTNATIQRYNQTFRHKDKPTDILAFPFYPSLKPGQQIVAADQEEKNLGDIIISLEYVQQAAKKLGMPFKQRMQQLLVHGICHLLGYDHEKDKDYALMQKKEDQLLKLLS